MAATVGRFKVAIFCYYFVFTAPLMSRVLNNVILGIRSSLTITFRKEESVSLFVLLLNA